MKEDEMRRDANSMETRRCLRLSCWLCVAVLLVFGTRVQGQLSSAPAQVALTGLHIDILEGEGALNNIRQRDAREPAVQVTDENHKPVGGVVVLFLIHDGANGAGATFAGQATSLSVTTGADGIARPSTLTLGKSPGSFTIAVSATLGTLVATAVIHQSNFLGPLNSSSNSTNVSTSTSVRHTFLGMSKTVAVLVGSGIVAGVVIGVVATNKTPGTSVTLGAGTIGP
jgi:hypothetical protein